jgi:hypothetical protein
VEGPLQLALCRSRRPSSMLRTGMAVSSRAVPSTMAFCWRISASSSATSWPPQGGDDVPLEPVSTSAGPDHLGVVREGGPQPSRVRTSACAVHQVRQGPGELRGSPRSRDDVHGLDPEPPQGERLPARARRSRSRWRTSASCRISWKLLITGFSRVIPIPGTMAVACSDGRVMVFTRKLSSARSAKNRESSTCWSCSATARTR